MPSRKQNDTFHHRWNSLRRSLPDESFSAIEGPLRKLLHRLQGDYASDKNQKELSIPKQIDDPAWNVIATRLRSGDIPNVLFVDIEYGRLERKCPHGQPTADDPLIPPCFVQPMSAREEKFIQMVQRFVSFERLELTRQLQITNSWSCPAVARIVSIANANGVSVLIDLFHLGGMPPAILDLFTNSGIHKIFFNLSVDLPILVASVSCLNQPKEGFYDATFRYELRPSGRIAKRKGTCWPAIGSPPSLINVFWAWQEGHINLPSSGQVKNESNLSALVDAFAGWALCKGRGLQGQGLDWFLERPANFFDAHNSEERRRNQNWRYYCLADARATAIVYISSLLIRRRWRSPSVASENVLTWIASNDILPPETRH